MTAAKKGDAKEVQRLIDIPEVDVNYADRSRMDAPRVLGNHTSLYLAARYGHEEVVKVLLQHPEVDVNHQDYHNRTPLWQAIYRGHLEVTKTLLNDNRTDVNMAGALRFSARNKPMLTPLHLASTRYFGPPMRYIPHHLEVVKLLVSHPQIHINEGSLQLGGENPLLIAARKGSAGVVKELLTHPKIDVNKVYE